MRVGIITYGLGRSITGVGRYSIELIRALSALDQVEVVLLAGEGLGPLENHGYEQLPIRIASIMPLLMTTGSAQLPVIARKANLDVIHDPIGTAPFLFGTGPAKSVTTIHDVFPLSFPHVSTQMDTLIYKRWLPYASRRVNAIITISEHSKQDITRYLNVTETPIHVTPLAADEIYCPASADQIAIVRRKYDLPEKYILFVGSIEKRKNLTHVLEAYAELLNRGIEHRLVLVGPKKWRFTEIMETVEKHHLSDKLVFTGYVDEADLPIIYSGARVFVFPSLYEGFGLPPLESMSCGTPVVTSHVSSLPEVVADAALTVDPHDVRAIADAVHHIIVDDAIYARLRTASLARSEAFSWHQTAQMTLDIYASLIE